MRTIYKYEVPLEGAFSLRMPKETTILSFQIQNFVPVIWAKVETAHVDEDRRFRLYGTGHPIANIPKDINLHYIGTVTLSQTPALVWHLFEEVKKNE